MYSVTDLLHANLTPYPQVELWITRTCLGLALFCFLPTIGLISLDLLIWAFRQSEAPAKTLLKRSRSGLHLVQQNVNARRSASGERVKSSSMKMTPSKSTNTTETEAKEVKGLTREETHPQGGVSMDTPHASEIKLGKVVD